MRLQLALNVDDIDEAVDYYSRLFDAEPAKRRDGYANFAIDEPPLKLVLFENPGNGGTINHLGVETESASEVEQAHARMVSAGLTTSTIDETMCCYAEKVETWATDPHGIDWEWYVKQGDVEVMNNVVLSRRGDGLERESHADDACCA
ncbi:MAG: glyoxalase/bleomycin resistance/extradiol dioxygenase family protein [Acidimicrobiales bacterium]|uniref:ArsI/CadI family heavy metal resistance metalloenzyme n=1 Tax=Candidatus Poriferisodalis multihospitum TaxID=2983191 RepID=UPI00137D44D2|nr:ArsI/CadI family heavy metal resistance metalloenzyme [Candidatus Poriferisodalis multihospitum]MCY3585938.1 VOC family protein [Acidimicrobiaceae bacterium]MXV87438.1 glyoxalase/bleomycin resistance/extradiol dioxygenase family protein [Acidimicrobiales bacterium]MCY3607205.1 VOC family protein [Acidimicrobiaceae bacterium]MCY3893778.1 VOC family protein [Acidimicrobiaceae bacterium]MDE0318774.1 VOC family protein [Acidimicrobiaceae bacterium]